MNTAWIVLGICVAVAVLVLALLRGRRDRDVDLGTVSHSWIAEQRTGRDRQQ